MTISFSHNNQNSSIGVERFLSFSQVLWDRYFGLFAPSLAFENMPLALDKDIYLISRYFLDLNKKVDWPQVFKGYLISSLWFSGCQVWFQSLKKELCIWLGVCKGIPFTLNCWSWSIWPKLRKKFVWVKIETESYLHLTRGKYSKTAVSYYSSVCQAPLYAQINNIYIYIHSLFNINTSFFFTLK